MSHFDAVVSRECAVPARVILLETAGHEGHGAAVLLLLDVALCGGEKGDRGASLDRQCAHVPTQQVLFVDPRLGFVGRRAPFYTQGKRV